MSRKWKNYLGGSSLISPSKSTFESNLARSAAAIQSKRLRAQKKFDEERERERQNTLDSIALAEENPSEYYRQLAARKKRRAFLERRKKRAAERKK